MGKRERVRAWRVEAREVRKAGGCEPFEGEVADGGPLGDAQAFGLRVFVVVTGAEVDPADL